MYSLCVKPFFFYWLNFFQTTTFNGPSRNKHTMSPEICKNQEEGSIKESSFGRVV